MNRIILKSSIASNIDDLGGTGYFSHCFLDCGFLGNEQSRITHEFGAARYKVFDLASLTKALVTAPLIFLACEEGRLTLGSQLGGLFGTEIPQWMSGMSIDQLLGHRSGLPAWRSFWTDRLGSGRTLSDNFPDRHSHILKVLKRISATQQVKGVVYSDIGFIVLGMVLEKIYKCDLEELFNRQIRDPLGLVGDAFVGGPLGTLPRKDQCVTTGRCASRGRELRGEVHDENCFALGGFSGHAGLFATGAGVAKLLRRGRELGFWRRYLSANAERLDTDKLAMLGLRPGDDPSSIGFAQGRAMGHLGFTGTAFWLEPATEAFAILLTNRVISGRVSHRIRSFRGEIFRDSYAFMTKSQA